MNVKTLLRKMLQEEPEVPPPDANAPSYPLNEAAQAEQYRHTLATTDLMERLRLKKEEFDKVVEEGRELDKALNNEMTRWGKTMRELQPELRAHNAFWIDPEGKTYKLPGVRSGVSQPEWAKEMIEAWEKETDAVPTLH